MWPQQHLTSPDPHPLTQRLFSHEDSNFQMFSSEAYGQKNLLFKDATSELVPIATQTYEAWLGPEYLHAIKGLLCDPNRKSTCLSSHCLQPKRTTRTAGPCSGDLAEGGHHPGRCAPLALMGTCGFRRPASGGLGRSPVASPGGRMQAIRACLVKGLLNPPTPKSSSPAIFPPQSLPPSPLPMATALAQALSRSPGPLQSSTNGLPASGPISVDRPPTPRETVCHGVRYMAAVISTRGHWIGWLTNVPFIATEGKSPNFP